MSCSPSCCDCLHYEPRPATPDSSHEGYCRLKRFKVRWYDVICNLFRKEPIQ